MKSGSSQSSGRLSAAPPASRWHTNRMACTLDLSVTSAHTRLSQYLPTFRCTPDVNCGITFTTFCLQHSQLYAAGRTYMFPLSSNWYIFYVCRVVTAARRWLCVLLVPTAIHSLGIPPGVSSPAPELQWNLHLKPPYCPCYFECVPGSALRVRLWLPGSYAEYMRGQCFTA